MDEDLFDAHIVRFFEEDASSAKINRTYLGLEIRITFDGLFDKRGAKLVNVQKGITIDVHPDTVKKYWELQSLIFDYTKEFGLNPRIEALGDKWSTTMRRNYFSKD